MANAATEERPEADTLKAAKDRNCPYCGQAFTSSSLGRHLDLYIKERNPKKPDGIHNVDEIRKLRGNVTRRQMKTSLGRRHTSTPICTPGALSIKGSVSDVESSAAPSPAAAKDARSPDPASIFPPVGRWEATGVINEVLANSSEDGGAEDDGRPGAELDLRLSGLLNRSLVPPTARPEARAEWDMKRRMQDAMDTARAAKLALREFLGSWRSAKLQIDLGLSPFDFDPLSLNFPALIIQCLRPAPTLFASTLHPTPSSWSTTPPGPSQFEALKIFFKEEFRKWRVKCAAATTAAFEELECSPATSLQLQDRAGAVERAETRADTLKLEADEHLDATFAAWASLSSERQTELWVLELARSVATKQTELDKMARNQHSLNQEVANLRSQIDQINRLQQPREYKIVPPMTIPMSEKLVMLVQDEALTRSRSRVGWGIDDRNADLDALLSVAVDRWKSVVVSARSANRAAATQKVIQKPAVENGNTLTAPPSASNRSATPSLDSPQQAGLPQKLPPRPGVTVLISPGATTAPAALMETTPRQLDSEQNHSTQQQQKQQKFISDAANADESEGDEDGMSDKDADAEMEDGDEFAHMHTPISRTMSVTLAAPPMPQQQLLSTPPIERGRHMMSRLKKQRTHGPVQQPLPMVASVSGALGSVQQNASRSVTVGHRPPPEHHAMRQADMGLTIPTLGADAMFMD